MIQHRGVLTLTGEGVTTQIEIVHCCHCQGAIGSAEELLHARVKGEGAFGFCPRCNALYHDRCATCRPPEKMCENVEAGRAPNDDGSAVRLFLPTAFPGK